jgi:hypothetical protein
MRIRVAVLATLLVGVGAPPAIAAAADPAVTVPVVRCPTSLGVAPGRPAVRRGLTLRGVPTSTAQLAAYTNTSSYLIGPSGLRCAGAIGADGNSTIQAWPRGQAKPGPHGAGAGLALSVIPACVGCKALATCHYFPTFQRTSRQIGLVCRPEPPPGERLRYLSRRLVAFTDSPFVQGAGWPSGGGLPSIGLVGIQPGRSQVVFTASCTLPTAERSVCVDSVDAERSLFSRPR